MNEKDFQTWLNSRGADLVVDGQSGPATQEATKEVFVNLQAKGISDRQVSRLATFLGCSYEQILAVATVESGGSSYDSQGRPKMLFERHKFSKWTDGIYDVTSYSNPDGGGYNEDSWDKLTLAAGKDIDAAFKSASWGKFQVLGEWYPNMGFTSSLQLAYSTVRGEFWHYILFVGYIKLVASLEDELRAISDDPDDCRAFAKGYNGPSYEEYDYHIKIANEYERLMEDAIVF